MVSIQKDINKGEFFLLPVKKLLLPVLFDSLLDTDSQNILFYILLH